MITVIAVAFACYLLFVSLHKYLELLDWKTAFLRYLIILVFGCVPGYVLACFIGEHNVHLEQKSEQQLGCMKLEVNLYPGSYYQLIQIGKEHLTYVFVGSDKKLQTLKGVPVKITEKAVYCTNTDKELRKIPVLKEYRAKSPGLFYIVPENLRIQYEFIIYPNSILRE